MAQIFTNYKFRLKVRLVVLPQLARAHFRQKRHYDG